MANPRADPKTRVEFLVGRVEGGLVVTVTHGLTIINLGDLNDTDWW